MTIDSTVERHRLRYTKYRNRLVKFNSRNNVDSINSILYDHIRDILYQIEINEKSLSDIKRMYSHMRGWDTKKITEIIDLIRTAYPKDWFKKRAQKQYMDSQRIPAEKPKWQFDINFNKIT